MVIYDIYNMGQMLWRRKKTGWNAWSIIPIHNKASSFFKTSPASGRGPKSVPQYYLLLPLGMMGFLKYMWTVVALPANWLSFSHILYRITEQAREASCPDGKKGLFAVNLLWSYIENNWCLKKRTNKNKQKNKTTTTKKPQTARRQNSSLSNTWG